MARWLVKSDPESYSYDDLERDGSTEWNGVHNALALRNLRQMRPGDELLIYHTGAERALVGLGRVTSLPRADPRDDRGSWLVDIAAVRPLRTRVPLATLRADPSLAASPLLKFGRLSVMPIADAEWRSLLGHEDDAPGGLKATPKGPARRAAPRRRASGARRRR